MYEWVNMLVTEKEFHWHVVKHIVYVKPFFAGSSGFELGHKRWWESGSSGKLWLWKINLYPAYPAILWPTARDSKLFVIPVAVGSFLSPFENGKYDHNFQATCRCHLSQMFLILLIVVMSSSMNMRWGETLIACTINSYIPIPEHFREERSLSLKYYQQDATFPQSIYFYKLLYMFQAVPPPIIRSRGTAWNM